MSGPEPELPLNHLARMAVGIGAIVLAFELVNGFSLSGMINGLLAGLIYLALLGTAMAFTETLLLVLWTGALAGATAGAVWSYVHNGTVLLVPLGVGAAIGLMAPIWELQER